MVEVVVEESQSEEEGVESYLKVVVVEGSWLEEVVVGSWLEEEVEELMAEVVVVVAGQLQEVVVVVAGQLQEVVVVVVEQDRKSNL